MTTPRPRRPHHAESRTDPDYLDRTPIAEATAGFIAALDRRLVILRRRLAALQDVWMGDCSCCPERVVSSRKARR